VAVERIATPMTIAMGIVAAMVNRPHGLSASAFTTTSASTASRMIMIAMMLMSATAPANGPDLVAHHLAERLAAAARRAEENHAVVHRAAERRADQHPQHAGQVAELRRQHRADQRPRPRDGREVVAEDDPLVRLHEILAVLIAPGPASPAGRRA
jgi:hypothetical protein